VEKGWPTATRGSRRIHGWTWEEEGVTGGEVPMAIEAAAERSSSARGFPARRVAKLGPGSCSRTRGSCWGGRIGWRRGGGRGSTAIGAYRRGGGRAALGLAWRARERAREEELGWCSGWGRRVEARAAGGGAGEEVARR
jgi:hypothetical protein